MHGLAVQIRHCKSVLKLKFKLAIMELWLTSPTETRSLWDCCYIKNIYTNDLELHLSQYSATIECFTMKSSKKKKEINNWFADIREESPDKLLCVSVFDILPLAVISVVRKLLVMQGVEVNPGPRHIFRMSLQVSSADIMDISMNVIWSDGRLLRQLSN